MGIRVSVLESFQVFRLLLNVRFRSSDLIKMIAFGSNSIELSYQINFYQVLSDRDIRQPGECVFTAVMRVRLESLCSINEVILIGLF